MTDLRPTTLNSPSAPRGHEIAGHALETRAPVAAPAPAAALTGAPTGASGPGVIDLADLGGTIRGFSMFGTAGLGLFDQAGFSVASVGDVDGDGFEDILVGEGGGYLGGAGSYNVSGMAYLINGKASGFADIELEDIDAGGSGDGGTYIYGGSSYAGVGFAVSGLGDINGDGFEDFILGAPQGQTPFTTYTNDGKAYVVFGDGAGLPDIDISALAATDGFTVNGVYGSGNELGWSVAGGGDLNGDGFDDALISSGNGDAGETFVIFGGAGPFADLERSSGTPSAAWTFTGGSGDAEDLFRATMAATGGDINGDGFDDLILGYLNGSSGALNDNGRVEIWLGGTGAPVSGGQLTGGASNDAAGATVANLGDVNGDGYDDVGVSAPGLTSGAAGVAYVVFGKAGGVGSVDLAALTDGFLVATGTVNHHLATDMASAGDVNGDGYDDVILSTSNANTGAGEAYVLFGRAGATNSFTDIDLSLLTTAQGFKILPEGSNDFLGGAVSSAGDLDGDGYDDLLIGAQGAKDSGDSQPSAGRAYVIFGSDVIAGVTSAVTDQGTSASEVLTGSAGDDVMIGGQGDDTLHGAGGLDAMRGGEGDDVLHVSDNTFRRLDGGTGSDTLLLDGMTLVDSAFLRVSNIATIALGDGTYDLTLGAIASNALDGRSIEIDGASATTAFVRINGLALDESLNVDLSNDALGVVLFGGAGDDDFKGGSGADAFMGGLGDDTFAGGGGRDRIMYDFAALGVTVDLVGTNAATGEAAGDVITGGIEDISGSAQADSLYGDDDAAGNQLYGLAANDLLDGRGGADTLMGGAGDDTLSGGGGSDTASYADSVTGVHVDLTVLTAQDTLGRGFDVLQSIENLLGSGDNDELIGDGGANLLSGGAGRDSLSGGGDVDTLLGGAGDDTLAGGAGSDTLAGDGGLDLASYAGMAGPVAVDLKAQTAVLGPDTDTLSRMDGAIGTDDNDKLSGNRLDNLFLAGDGLDKLFGRGGDDTLDGGASADKLSGGLGDDTFVFRAAEADGDRVVDFTGNGAATGDQIFFYGYGTDGTFTDLGGGMWEVANLARTIIEVIDLGVGTTVHATDYVFDPV